MGKTKKKYVVVVEEGCSGCEELEKTMPDLNYIDVSKSEDAENMADDLRIQFVPTVLSVDGKGRICILDENMKVIRCVRKRASAFPSLARILKL